MINSKVIINTIPEKLKSLIIKYIHETSHIIGYRKLNKYKKMLLIKFEDETRIWILYEEIEIL
uniref:Cytochrome b6-f complex subunit PetP n=1 Tax=Sphondylothamnion multifidum TaxID=193186 RepID=A0A4D6WYI8_9FLOR|nr:cytochrome b6-f complex subunit PetP [Sphondylothamnion multifidum]